VTCTEGAATKSGPVDPDLLAAKLTAGLRVSVCIPARDEAATVAGVVGPVVRELMTRGGLVDEVVLVDDGSVDRTGPIAAALGAVVVRRSGTPGKGLAMARAALVATGDVVVFLDADVRDFGAHFVTALLRPHLLDDTTMLVKGSYRRSRDGVDGEGGRVTELLARPVLELLFPDLAFVAQPLAGEVAIRREALDALVLEPGYGVEVGMLIDVARHFGPGAIAQVDLGHRLHRNRPLPQLAGQAREVLAAILARTADDRLRPAAEAGGAGPEG